MKWGRKIGRLTAELLERILASKPHPKQGFRTCLGVIRLGDEYSHQRLEAVTQRALRHSTYSYKNIESMLKCNLDTVPEAEAQPPRPPLD